MRAKVEFVDCVEDTTRAIVITYDDGKKEYWAVDTVKGVLEYIPFGDDPECEKLKEEFME